jgi:PAS domain S-box-containing protein
VGTESKNGLTDKLFAIGELGALIRGLDWSKTSLGPIDEWPQSLKISLNLMLNSQHPMWIGWGPDNIFLYNDAYLPVLGMAKHPWALGKPAKEVWAEIWDICGPLSEKVYKEGKASFVEGVRLFMSRGEFLEETYYCFSYSPIQEESGTVGGLFSPWTDLTPKVLNARRLKTLSELAAKALVAKSTEEACSSSFETLSRNPDDIPFGLLYLIDDQNKGATLKETLRIPAGIERVSPFNAEIENGISPLWPRGPVVSTSHPRVVSVRDLDFLPLGPAKQKVGEAILLPLICPGQERPMGSLIVGINPTRKLDLEYAAFYDIIAGQVAAAIQNARAVETEREAQKLAQEKIKASEERFRKISEAIPTLVWTSDSTGAITFYNKRWYDYTGLTWEQGKLHGWERVLHPDDLEGARKDWLQMVKQGLPLEKEWRLRRASDGQYRWHLIRAFPLKDEFQNVVEYFGTNTDIHDVKQVQEELIRSNTELARFAFVASHDLKEPLRVVTNYVQMLAMKYKGNLDVSADLYIKYIVDSVARMYELINDLLSYSRLDAGAPTTKAMNSQEVVRQALNNLAAAIAESNGHVHVGTLPMVKADPSQYLQLFQNLISNAIKYRGAAPPEIEIGAERVNGTWRFSVKDNGIGIHRKFFEKIFILFQRLHSKDTYSGTGIGLAVCKKIVERHGGKIWVESEEGKGSTFFFTLGDQEL